MGKFNKTGKREMPALNFRKVLNSKNWRRNRW